MNIDLLSHSAWKVGVEIELLAPKGSNRYFLAEAIAQQNQGYDVYPIFHHESEPSKVIGQKIFENLTLGFKVADEEGNVLVKCVDDLTLQHDLDRNHPPQAGWFRIVSDDKRLLRVVARHVNWEEGFPDLLYPLEKIFGAPLRILDNGLASLYDEAGDSVFIGAPLPGERERPCELITSPMLDDRADQLQQFLHTAQQLEFMIPLEGAIHLHFDAQRLKTAKIFRRLIQFFSAWGRSLKRLVKSNPNCKRLGDWDPAIIEFCQSKSFEQLTWKEITQRLLELEVSKYCDFNFLNMIRAQKTKNTFEIRILPSTLDPHEVLMSIELFEAILKGLVLAKDFEVSAPQKESEYQESEYQESMSQLIRALSGQSLLSQKALDFWLDTLLT